VTLARLSESFFVPVKAAHTALGLLVFAAYRRESTIDMTCAPCNNSSNSSAKLSSMGYSRGYKNEALTEDFDSFVPLSRQLR